MRIVRELFLLSLDVRAEGFERADVRAILARDAMPSHRPDRWMYGDGSGGTAHGLDTAGRPYAAHLLFTEFGGATMMARLFEIVDRLDVVLFWPQTRFGAPNACVTRVERVAKLGTALRSVLRLEIVRDAGHLAELLDATPPARPGGAQ